MLELLCVFDRCFSLLKYKELVLTTLLEHFLDDVDEVREGYGGADGVDGKVSRAGKAVLGGVDAREGGGGCGGSLFSVSRHRVRLGWGWEG